RGRSVCSGAAAEPADGTYEFAKRTEAFGGNSSRIYLAAANERAKLGKDTTDIIKDLFRVAKPGSQEYKIAALALGVQKDLEVTLANQMLAKAVADAGGYDVAGAYYSLEAKQAAGSAA